MRYNENAVTAALSRASQEACELKLSFSRPQPSSFCRASQEACELKSRMCGTRSPRGGRASQEACELKFDLPIGDYVLSGSRLARGV